MTRFIWLAILVAALGLVACGGSAAGPGTASSAISPTRTSDARTSSPATAMPTPRPPLLVVQEQLTSLPGGSVVRLVRLDATDVASTPGRFLSITGGDVVVLDGATLKSMGYDGTVQTMGSVAAAADPSARYFVAVSPDRSQWMYSVVDYTTLTSTIHVGSAGSDRVLTTLTSPGEQRYLASFAWTSSGMYLDEYAYGIGGAGPFLEYNFPLWQLDLGTLKASPASPPCTIIAFAKNGTELCTAGPSQYAIVPPGGAPHDVTLVGQSAAERLSVDGTRVALARNGGTDSSVFYQMATFGIGDSTATDFGPKDFAPSTWLPDGRLVATHGCILSSFQGAPCDTTKDGTYIFSADGTSSTLFYKWPATRDVTVIACLPGRP